MKTFYADKSGIEPIVDVLLGSKNASYSNAINCLLEHDRGKSLNPLGEKQDAWRILTFLLELINRHSTRSDIKPLYPIFGCDCGQKNGALFQGSLDYKR